MCPFRALLWKDFDRESPKSLGEVYMKCLGKVIFCALLSGSSSIHAAFNIISDHSRANCLNNESITWDGTRHHMLDVVSFHTRDYLNKINQYSEHRVEAPWEKTWRAAAVHWGEGATVGLYLVQGWHWEYIADQVVLRATTSTDGCSIYNGWWDY